MEKLINEIAEHFTSSKDGARVVESIPKEFLTLTLKDVDYYGVAILNTFEKQINESFTNVKIKTENIKYMGEVRSFIMITSSLFDHRLTFATTCAEFATLGDDNEDRLSILNNPIEWFKKYKGLFGNVNVEKNVYSIIAEMWVYLNELKTGHINIDWEGPKSKNHDIEGENYHIEVKSTIVQFDNEVTISNQFQLDSNTKLHLDFVKLQKSNDGYSINYLTKELLSQGIDEVELEKKLSSLRVVKHSIIRDEKYRILEARRYLVDENFPIIKASSFVGGQIPKNIKKITYTIDLSSYEYDTIDISE